MTLSRQGRVVKTYNQWYEVAVDGESFRCQPRGRLKRGEGILTGDEVRITVDPAGKDLIEGVIEEVLPRRNRLLRPAIANVDQVFIVFTLHDPPHNRELLERTLVLAEASDIEPVLILNKIDLAEDEAEVEEVRRYFAAARYPLHPTAAKFSRGVEALDPYLPGGVTVLAGQSGVGKSRLLNALLPDARLATGEVSAKGHRGRHTTRHVQLLPLPQGGWVADAPGFSRLDVTGIPKEELAFYFADFRPYLGNCRFRSCLHDREPDCGIQQAVAEGHLLEARHQRYRQFLGEIRQWEENRY